MNFEAIIKELNSRDINITKIYIAHCILSMKDSTPTQLNNDVNAIYNIYINSVCPDLMEIINDFIEV